MVHPDQKRWARSTMVKESAVWLGAPAGKIVSYSSENNRIGKLQAMLLSETWEEIVRVDLQQLLGNIASLLKYWVGGEDARNRDITGTVVVKALLIGLQFTAFRTD